MIYFLSRYFCFIYMEYGDLYDAIHNYDLTSIQCVILRHFVNEMLLNKADSFFE